MNTNQDEFDSYDLSEFTQEDLSQFDNDVLPQFHSHKGGSAGMTSPHVRLTDHV